MENQKIKLNSKVILIIALVSFVCYAIPCIFFTTPVFTDGLNTMAVDFFVKGYDWKEYLIADGYYYKYGTAIIYLPFFFLTDNPHILYVLLLIVNAAFSTIVPILAYIIAVKHFKIRNSKAILIAGVSGLLPWFTLNNKYTWAENTISIIPWIIILLILDLVDENCKAKKFKLILIAIFSVFAYMSHERGIVVVIATFMLIIFMFIKKVIKIKELLIFSGVTILFLGFDYGISSLIKQFVFSANDIQFNTTKSILNSELLSEIFSYDGFKTCIRIVMGWTYNIFTSTYGLMCVAIVTSIVSLVSYFRLKKLDFKEVLVIIFALLLFMGAFALGALFFFDNIFKYYNGEMISRCDKLIYGRYIESASMLLCFWGIYALIEKKAVTKKIIISICLIWLTVLIFFILYISPRMENSTTWIHILMTLNIFCDLTPYGAGMVNIPNYSMYLIAMGIISYIIGMLCLIFNKRHGRIVCYILMCVYSITYIRSLYNVIYTMDRYAQEQTTALDEILDDVDLPKEYKVIYIDDQLLRIAFQYKFPDYYIVTERDKNRYSIDNMFIVSPSGTWNEAYFENDYYILNEDTTKKIVNHVYIKGDELKLLLDSLGIKSEKYLIDDMLSFK